MWFLLIACVDEPRAAAPPPDPAPAEPAPDPFAAWLDQPESVADGFDAPLVDARSCGIGCFRAFEGDVRAIADGEVVGTAPLRLRHAWYENELPTVASSTYADFTSDLPLGAAVRRGQVLGRSAEVPLSIEGVADPAAFVASHGTLVVPRRDHLVLISHEALELRVIVGGEETLPVPVALGQTEGAKVRRGDNRTPKGLYWAVEQSRGPFTGPTGPWLGDLWMRLDYPNAWDARRGLDAGLVTPTQADAIVAAWTRAGRHRATPRSGAGSGSTAGSTPGTPTGRVGCPGGASSCSPQTPIASRRRCRSVRWSLCFERPGHEPSGGRAR